MRNQKKLLSSFMEYRFEDFKRLLEYSDIDVDYFYGEPNNGTLLDLANRYPRNEHYIFELIKNGVNIWRKDEKTGKLKIHEMFSNSDQYLLYKIWDGVYFSSVSGNENANIMKVAVEENDIEAITLLARSYSTVHDRFNDGRPEGQHLILLQGSIDAVRLFIKFFDVDKEFQKDSQGRVFSCREIILQKYSQLEADFPTPSPSELQKILFLYLEKGVPELFVRRIAEINTELLNDGRQEITMFTYLHVACEYNYIDVVDALLKKNVLLNELVPYFNEFAQHVTPIMLAGFGGHYEIFNKFLSIPDVELQNTGGSGSVLHLVLHGMQFMQDRNCSTRGHCMILESLLELRKFTDKPTLMHTKLYIEWIDKSNRTALHYALKHNNEFAIKLLLRAGAKLYLKDQSLLTSISATIIGRYFDECIRSCGESVLTRNDKDNPIIFHYRIFTQLDLYSIATRSKGNFFAQFESITEMRKLYKHPLTKSLLYLKWRLVKKYYFINLAFYLSFCLALSTYIFLIRDCLPSSSNFNGSGSTDAANNRDASPIPCDVSLWMWLIIFPLYIILILRELCQFSVSIREYFSIPENWLEITMIVVIGFLFVNQINTHLAAIVILSSWIGLILLLGKQPSLSIYIEMFKKVALNFAKFLLLYSILVASFAYSFFILFRNKTRGRASSSQNQANVNTTDGTNENSVNSWQDLQMSFFKSILMMTGEFEASALPLNSSFSYGHVFFILFVFLVSMILYNLLNGLAVSDIRAIMEDVETVALISRAKLISQIERLAISNPFRHVRRCRTKTQLEKGYRFLRDKLFGKVFIDETTAVKVYSTKSNRIVITEKNFGKMPSTIVKNAEEILEKRKRSHLAKNKNQGTLTDVSKNKSSKHQFVSEFVLESSEQISFLKLQKEAKIAARDEKLLQNVDQRFGKMMNKLLNEQTSDLELVIDAKIAARDEKLLQNVDQRFDKMMNKLLDAFLREANVLKNNE